MRFFGWQIRWRKRGEPKFLEYDVVRLLSAERAPGVPLGTSGTILIVYPATPAEYEVEFMDNEGKSFGTFTMRERDLAFEWRPKPDG